MSIDYGDAPPLDDRDYPGPPVAQDSTLALAKAVDRLADSFDHLAVSLQALGTASSYVISPGGAPAQHQPPVPPSGPPSAPPGGSDDRKTKMGKKVFAICKQNDWEIGDIGQRVTGRPIGADSRKWSLDDLTAVLDAFKEWGVG